MSNFWEAIQQNNFETFDIQTEYRLFYDKKTKEPLFFLECESNDTSGDYIVISKEQFETFRIEYTKIADDNTVYEIHPTSYQLEYKHPFKDKKFSWILGEDSE